MKKITNESLLDIGFTFNEKCDYKKQVGRQTFIVCKAQDNDYTIVYSYDVGVDFGFLRFVDYIEQVENIIKS